MSTQRFKLSARSRSRLTGVHPDLVRVVERAIQLTDVDFAVIEGVRTLAKQREYVASGASQTLNGRHLTGHAVDLAAYVGRELRWDWPLYHKIAAAMKQAAVELSISIVWGGDWKKFPDGPHFELSRKDYP
jgi:peptidoglycan L-alanyl-D-glutamate endopeptidase CwlK